MICLEKSPFGSGLDLNFATQTSPSLRAVPAGGSDASRQARFRAGHGAPAAVDVPAFKWIKQHLRIKAFFGTSENAVKTRIWIEVATYVLIAIVKKRAMLPHSLYELLQILSLTMFETTPINQPLTPPPLTQDDDQQLVLL